MNSDQIIIYNQTYPAEDTLRVAVYKKNLLRPNPTILPWCVVNPSAGGRAILGVSPQYEIYISYDTGCARYESNIVSIQGETAMLEAIPTKDDKSAQRTISIRNELVAVGLEAKIQGHIQVDVPAGLGRALLVHLCQNGKDIVPPVKTSPGATADFQVHPAYFLAVVHQNTAGDQIVQAVTVSTKETEILPGHRAFVTGNEDKGYTIIVE